MIWKPLGKAGVSWMVSAAKPDFNLMTIKCYDFFLVLSFKVYIISTWFYPLFWHHTLLGACFLFLIKFSKVVLCPILAALIKKKSVSFLFINIMLLPLYTHSVSWQSFRGSFPWQFLLFLVWFAPKYTFMKKCNLQKKVHSGFCKWSHTAQSFQFTASFLCIRFCLELFHDTVVLCTIDVCRGNPSFLCSSSSLF